MIALKEVIQILESGQWCSLRFITADLNKGTGGKVIEIAKCRIARRYINNTSSEILQVPGVTSSSNKTANHNYNFTRNVELPNNKLRKVHPILITHINNTAVL